MVAGKGFAVLFNVMTRGVIVSAALSLLKIKDMKLLLTIFFSLAGLISFAQSSEQLQSLINAEKGFAKISKEKSTKEAFSTSLSDIDLIFLAGPVLGQKFWHEAEAGTDMLSREPVFADISSSGELGYTIGPWKFRANRTDEKAAVVGYYGEYGKMILLTITIRIANNFSVTASIL